MKHLSLLLLLMSLVSCATKYVMPTNRFITPEVQGGVFRGQFELQSTKGIEATVNTDEDTVDQGVFYHSISRTGYLLSSSLFNSFDFIWSHMGGGNSMVGGKYQFIGGNRTENSVGHKLAVAAIFGSNEHETEDRSIEFTMGGQEAILLYGYRITPNVLPYGSFSYARYSFRGEIHSPPALSGLEPSLETTVMGANGGVEFSFNSVFVKAEGSYQQLTTTDTKDKNQFTIGVSGGVAW